MLARIVRVNGLMPWPQQLVAAHVVLGLRAGADVDVWPNKEHAWVFDMWGM